MPILNGATINWIKPNTLVRFRGMIQDMLGNELYVGAYKVKCFLFNLYDVIISVLFFIFIIGEVTCVCPCAHVFLQDGSAWRTNKFMDISQCPVEFNSPDMRLWDRRLLYCVPVSFLHNIFPAFLCRASFC